jgi:uncharacterized protein YecT (DUF1311 family)
MKKFTDLKTCVVATASMLAFPVVALASGGYASFQPTQNRISAAFSEDFKTCYVRAGVNSMARQSCVDGERSLAMRRVEERVRFMLTSMPETQAQALRIDQQSWLRTHRNLCADKYEKETLFTDKIVLTRQCLLLETTKRTMWLQGER